MTESTSGGDLAIGIELSGERPGQEGCASGLDRQEGFRILSQGEVCPDDPGDDR